MHADELAVTDETVRKLVDAQFPIGRVPVERVNSEGTVNTIFRIGDRLSARFPLRPAPVDSDPSGASLRGRRGPAARWSDPFRLAATGRIG